MKKIITALFCFICFYVHAEGSLRNLIEYDKAACLQRLQESSTEELWDALLEGQTPLFGTPEIEWLNRQTWWQQGHQMLDLGTGNGAFLARIAEEFPDKVFRGVEKLPASVASAKLKYASDRVSFIEGNAEILNTQLINSADLVLFRYVLQHLQNPLLALHHAWHYLSDGGHLFILDSCDTAFFSSHPIRTISEAMVLVVEAQEGKGRGNRKISGQIQTMLEDHQSPLTELYELVFSNLDREGNIDYKTVRFEGKATRKLYYNHALLFLTLVNRVMGIPVQLAEAYDELQEYLDDEQAWITPGTHFLVLKKRGV